MTRYAKSFIAFAVAGVGSLATASADGTLTLPEYLTALAAALAALGAVYGVPNKGADRGDPD